VNIALMDGSCSRPAAEASVRARNLVAVDYSVQAGGGFPATGFRIGTDGGAGARGKTSSR